MFAEKFPYAIYYEIQNSIAIVIAVLDMRKKPSVVRNQLKHRKR